MIYEDTLTVGVDLGGTKIEVALVDATGSVLMRRRLATRVGEGPVVIQSEIIETVMDLRNRSGAKPAALGIGVAGQVDPVTGTVHFANNLGWREVPIGRVLGDALGMPVFVTNDVRAATWGEWLYGAGRGCGDIVCLFVGTGIGGGIVSGGRMLAGCSNTAGELGHITVDLNGPRCNCGNRGCMEALAGGWAIARRARESVENDPVAGASMLRKAGGHTEGINTRIVSEAAAEGDPVAAGILETAARALAAGAVGLVNAFNPGRLILGGGVIEGLPWLVDRIDEEVHRRALAVAGAPLQVLPSQLGNDAGVIGAAIMAMRLLAGEDPEEPENRRQ
ncbi:MAG TPA: ROK family protein [Geobacteraceae bacterium]|nr:ROK family protein [Geobacteraceae bacterium]